MGSNILRRPLPIRNARVLAWTAAAICAVIVPGASPVASATPAAEVAASTLVPRDLLFRAPTYSELQISPDGKQLAFLHPLNGVLNVWVAPIDDPAAGKPVTRFDSRPPDAFQWSADGR